MIYRQVWLASGLLIASASVCRADIFRWDNGQSIPGTEGITPGPGVQLSNRNLEFADFSNKLLTSAQFAEANLTRARFESSTLTNADLRGANLFGSRFGSATLTNADLREATLSGASFEAATLTNANLEGAVLGPASFWGTTSHGFTKEQLYSTASYQAKDLRRIGLGTNNLTGWDFSGQDLTSADFFGANLTNADLTGAVVTGASFSQTVGFMKEQLYSTASYQAKDLRGFDVGPFWSIVSIDLTGWDFSGQNLTDAILSSATLTDANLSGANLTNASLLEATLTNSDLTGANLTGAYLYNSDLTGADFRGAQGVNLAGDVSSNAILPDGKIAGLALTAGERMLVRHYVGLPDANGRPPIPVMIEDRLIMARGSVLQLLFDAEPWDSLISFEPGIPVQIAGVLELTFADHVDVATQLGRTLDLFDWTGVSPSFQFEIRSPYLWDMTNLYTTGEVTLVAVPEPTACAIICLSLAGFVLTRRKKVVVPEPTSIMLRLIVFSALVAIRSRRIAPRHEAG
jgi:uncharacterized protein YjbI with pentapeptide repeats